MNLPNKLSIMRIILIPVFTALYFIEFQWHKLAAMIVFFVACVTDFFDGYIARREHQETALGNFLDTMADKMLVSCALIALCVTPPVVENANIFATCVIVFTMFITCREMFMIGFRSIAASKKITLKADKLGKVKAASQMAALILLLPVEEYATIAGNVPAAQIVYYVGFGLLALATLLTVTALVNYLVKYREVFADEQQKETEKEQAQGGEVSEGKESE